MKSQGFQVEKDRFQTILDIKRPSINPGATSVSGDGELHQTLHQGLYRSRKPLDTTHRTGVCEKQESRKTLNMNTPAKFAPVCQSIPENPRLRTRAQHNPYQLEMDNAFSLTPALEDRDIFDDLTHLSARNVVTTDPTKLQEA